MCKCIKYGSRKVGAGRETNLEIDSILIKLYPYLDDEISASDIEKIKEIIRVFLRQNK